MIEGLEGDDKYVMVEDEFHVAAKAFTQHLHHAEYVRLKQLSKSRNTSKIHTISRSVAPRAEIKEDAKRMRTLETKSRLQKGTLREVMVAKDASESDMDDLVDNHEGPWAGTSLQGLMASPKRAERSLIAVSDIRSSTRAAAGFKKAANGATPTAESLTKKETSELAPARPLSRGEATASEGGDDDDDLDAPLHVKVGDNAHHSAYPGVCNRASGNGHQEDVQIKRSSSKQRKNSNSRGDESKSRPQTSCDFLPKPTTLPGEASQLLSRRMTKSKTEKAGVDHRNGRSSSIFDEIPTFLV
ncbi:hypothetical protein GP486_002845 [Trichoglossum hirsutum]|uniref:Uncharacterized protein n=1 Tax=Trichoglossum hirsutum TaxID=265104 RepID=A0A9P8LEF4_9PEZI|nr:hypothetical protein GP486_002845 [Trichoglossum hirsutum]